MAATQWGLAKSYPAFGPTGPWLVTADELPDPDDIEISCTLNGKLVQHASTSRMIYSVPQIVAELSSFCTLYPGDVIFTGTMSGVGLLRKPPRYLKVGDVVVTEVNGWDGSGTPWWPAGTCRWRPAGSFGAGTTRRGRRGTDAWGSGVTGPCQRSSTGTRNAIRTGLR